MYHIINTTSKIPDHAYEPHLGQTDGATLGTLWEQTLPAEIIIFSCRVTNREPLKRERKLKHCTYDVNLKLVTGAYPISGL